MFELNDYPGWILLLFKQFCCCCCLPVMSDSLQAHGLQHARPPCPSLCPGVCQSSYLLYWQCHPVILSSDALLPFCPQPLSVHIRWPKHCSFSFSISPSSEYSGLISLKIDWYDLLSVQVSFRSLLQHHSPKASILWHSVFFMVQLSQTYMTTGKTIALGILIFDGRVMSLLFNTLSRFCHCFPAKQSLSEFMAAVTIHRDFEAHEEETCHYFHHFPFHLPHSNGADAMILLLLFFNI